MPGDSCLLPKSEGKVMQDQLRDSVVRLGFSLLELVVVLGLLGVLLGLLLPAVQRARDAALRTGCQNNLKQIGLALHHFHDSYGRFPPQRALQRVNTSRDPDTLLSWMSLILPYVEQDGLWSSAGQACRSDPITVDNPPHVGYTAIVPAYICPADGRLFSPLVTPSGDRAAFTSYIGIAGIRGVVGSGIAQPTLRGPLGASPGVRLTDIMDGTSQTLMAGERPPPSSLQAGRWYSTIYVLESFGGPDSVIWFPPHPDPRDIECPWGGNSLGPGRLNNPCDRFHLWSLHPGGANGLFADGSVRFLGNTLAGLIPAMSTCAGGEVVDMP
jgi:prepilin-type processing-associated H-X9-DG protein/prepilin-type N-terminal cleavage/methylation domain-containing protein